MKQIVIKKWIDGEFREVKRYSEEEVVFIRHHTDGLEIILKGNIRLYDIQCIIEFEEKGDDNIGKHLLNWFKDCKWDAVDNGTLKRDDIIAWLEKRVEQEQTELPNGEDYGIDSLYHAARILEKILGEVDGYQSDDGILEHKCAIEAVNRIYKQKTTDIEKACEWLKNNAGKYAFVDTDRIGNVADIDLSIVQDFRKYMKGE